MDNRKLFVGNMAARITQRDLWRFFSSYGAIDECAKFHESYAFIRFVYAEDARRARQETQGAILKGRKLKVEFAANANKRSSSSCNQKKSTYIEPLRCITNMATYYSPVKSSLIKPDCKQTNNQIHSANLLNNEEFFTPDLLRLAGIQISSPDDGYETNSSPVLNNSCDSRFFPISMHTHNAYQNALSDQNNRRNTDSHLLSLDFARIRLFSDVSSGFGDDSNSLTE